MIVRLLMAWVLLCAVLLPPLASLAQFGSPSQLAVPVVPASCASTTLNPADKGTDIVLSAGNLTVSSTSAGAWESVRTIASHTTGKYYFEVKWTTADSDVLFGAMDGTGPLNNFIGSDTHSGSYFVTGDETFYNGAGHAAGFSPLRNDVFGIALDITNKLLWSQDWTRTTGWFGSAAGNPAAGTNGLALSTIGNPVFAAGSIFRTGSITFNFGATAFVGTVPVGFTGCF